MADHGLGVDLEIIGLSDAIALKGLYLAHVAASVFLLHVADVKHPRPLVVERDAVAREPRYDVSMNGYDHLSV